MYITFKTTINCDFITSLRCGLSLGILRNHDGKGNENVTKKYVFTLSVLLCDDSKPFSLYHVAELSGNIISRDRVGIHVLLRTFNLIISRCFNLPKRSKKCIKIFNAPAEVLLCSFNVFFSFFFGVRWY